MNVDVSINAFNVVLFDVPIPIGCGFKAGHPDGMHAVLFSGLDVVKVLPLHEVKRATAVKVVRYGNPFARIHRIFDFSIRFANRTSDPQRSFFGGIVQRLEEIVQRLEEIASCVDPMSGLYTASFTRLSKEFWFRGRKKLSRGSGFSSELRSSSSLSPSPTSSPPDGDDESSSSSLK